jgi:N-acetylmuramoyl-L-alanine amidase
MQSFLRRIAAVTAAATATVGTLGAMTTGAIANSPFGQQEVDQGKFIAVAAPIGSGNAHQLLILEQVSNSRRCWNEAGNAPVEVDPLLLGFDFTGICGRSTDSNGYSIRMNGQDLGVQYSLRVARQNGEMVLVGVPFRGQGETLEIGRTGGITNNFAKISLDDGWRFTKRTYDGRTLGHVYLTYDGTAAVPTPGGGTTLPPLPTPTPTPTPGGSVSFRDTANDIYAQEINTAVAMGFIAGFREDNTFRPQAQLTREQLVSMVLESLLTLPDVDLTLPTTTSRNPFPDVAASRWSAAKIQFAQESGIVTGYQDGLFRPTQAVTRAELMAVLRRAAEYAQTLQGNSATPLPASQTAFNFSDIGGHWANPLISQMSTYCGVASPLNERGTTFAPNSAAQRNYAAAATLRMLNCAKGE